MYGWVLERGYVDPEAMLAELDLSRDQLAETVSTLTEMRLLRPLPDGTNVVACRPDVAAAEIVGPLEDHIQRVQRAANQTRSQFDPLMSMYLATESRKRREKDEIDVLPDRASVNALLDEAANSCTSEVITMQPGGGRPREQLQRAFRRDEALLERGVKFRTLYQHSARFDAATRDYVGKAAKAGAQIRTVRELNSKMIIFDREMAFIPAAGSERGAVVVREPAVVAFLCGIFDESWGHGMEFVGELRSQSEERALANSVKSSILRLLVQGVRDDTIARRMGISVRTCRRHIAEIMEQAGAESRFQAGYLVAGRQLLDAQD
ncbi:LuxR C-terminal-related transcriptional regulator [Kitasatospora viridis]|uniref:LuxR C-terminal-related transcriptional regulator n=1 Tax=Kitasatospora viridis TaxID=281105 RepID=UPI0011A9306C|nr:LuxR C-terminal-related transcriptional regulator [Kitasatospora viridis]